MSILSRAAGLPFVRSLSSAFNRESILDGSMVVRMISDSAGDPICATGVSKRTLVCTLQIFTQCF